MPARVGPSHRRGSHASRAGPSPGHASHGTVVLRPHEGRGAAPAGDRLEHRPGVNVAGPQSADDAHWTLQPEQPRITEASMFASGTSQARSVACAAGNSTSSATSPARSAAAARSAWVVTAFVGALMRRRDGLVLTRSAVDVADHEEDRPEDRDRGREAACQAASPGSR